MTAPVHVWRTPDPVPGRRFVLPWQWRCRLCPITTGGYHRTWPAALEAATGHAAVWHPHGRGL